MPIPNKVKVGWKTYDVILADPTLNGGDELYGQIDYDRCTITLRAAASPDQQMATLVHELLHAVSNMYGLDLNEKLVTDLANALYCVYKDNSSHEDADKTAHSDGMAPADSEITGTVEADSPKITGGIEWLFDTCGEADKTVKARIMNKIWSSGDIQCIDADEMVIFARDGDRVFMEKFLERRGVVGNPEDAARITEDVKTKIFCMF